MKSGWKSTEFWMTIFAQLLGVLATTGLLTPDQASTLTESATQVAGIVAIVASAFGYSISRGNAKRNMDK